MKNSKKNAFDTPLLDVKDLDRALFETTLRLDESNKKLRESEAMRSQLIGNLSHDFRSPVTTLKSYVEYLLSFEHLDEEETFSTLKQMEKKIQTLDYMLNEFFLFTSLDHKEIEYNFEKVHLNTFLISFFNECSQDKKYSERVLRLELSLPDDFTITIDKHLVSILLDNLFTNSLKFSSPGDKITLGNKILDNVPVFFVKDTGMGIKNEDIPKIFDRAYMVSSARNNKYLKGSGLGLSIAKEITKIHNGKIWCESTHGKETTFYIAI